MTIVSVSELRKTYDDVRAVDDITFDIKEGEIFGFLGPNGAGKTSTINMMIGLSRPTSGIININGIDAVKDIKKAQNITGIVEDESNLYGDMDGFDNLCFCAALYGMRKTEREKRANELLEIFNLKSAGKRPFKAYSKGMRRKLTIAAAIMHNPKILFLDEPTVGIDVESARQISNLIMDMKKCGTTIFLTTHNIEYAQKVCDRIAFIVEGKIVKTGTLNELMQNADNEHILRLSLSADLMELGADLKSTFPKMKFETKIERQCLITSPERIALSPIIRYLDTKGISVFEAKEIRPSLEDVFVKITGIEAAEMKKEKEGGRR